MGGWTIAIAPGTGSSRPTATSTSRPTCGPAGFRRSTGTGRPGSSASTQGDAWVIEGVDDPITFGMNACAGLAPEEMKGWMRFEDIRRGGYDPAARLVELDRDGVDAEVLYPTPRLSAAIVANPDVGYHETMVRAYNDWLSEYVEYAPDRFGGLAVIPNRGVEGARRGDRPRRRPTRHPRLRDGLLSERHARDPARGRQGVRTHRGDRCAAQHPRVAHPDHARRAPRAASRVGTHLRHPEPHARAHLRGRVRPLPGSADGRRRKSTAVGCPT